ncbi:MAG: hypothetical protein ISS61_00160 [Desulfobacteraceae bacterium]|nr:hypothetical protein [Desulfobacteraceae bacterium]
MDGLGIIAELMAVAARTAPKSGGIDDIEIKIVDGPDLAKLGDEMVAYGERNGLKNFDRDGGNVKASGAVVLIGVKTAKPGGLNCGACGYSDCKGLTSAPQADVQFAGPNCAYKLLDLGIALGSAVKTASLMNADNRIMYRIGAVAREMKLMDAAVIMGIPLASTGKNIFFDRK